MSDDQNLEFLNRMKASSNVFMLTKQKAAPLLHNIICLSQTNLHLKGYIRGQKVMVLSIKENGMSNSWMTHPVQTVSRRGRCMLQGDFL